ncbi:hypothetical protein RIF29_08359 [Crotalaria pallida]|uniref:GRF-type domain-containing protein n=1 Tax=Crotalaria pallida TaxID=3830 RepID=A0AAN9FQQ8_CROPI
MTSSSLCSQQQWQEGFLAADSMASSSKSNLSSSRNESYGNSGYWPYCHCEEKAFIWTTRTNRNNNKGRRFWGCSHYQKDVAGSGCGYFEWYNQGSVDERDIMIMRQRMKLKTVERSLLSCKRQLKFTLIAACVFFVMNVICFFILWNLGGSGGCSKSMYLK